MASSSTSPSAITSRDLSGRRLAVGERQPEFPEEQRQVVEEGVVVEALGAGVVLGDPLGPPVDDDAGVLLEDGPDADVLLGAEERRLGGHAGASLHKRQAGTPGD